AQHEARVEECRCDAGHEPMSDGIRRAEQVCGGLRLPVDPPYHREPLLRVGQEQVGDRLAVQDHGKLPAEIQHVTDAGVHSLTAARAVPMSGLTAEKDPAVAQDRTDARAGTNPTAPADTAQPAWDG